MASQEQFLKALAKPYDRLLFAKDVLKPVFGNSFKLEEQLRQTGEKPNKTEQQSIKTVGIYGKITLDDGRTVTCYEIELQPRVRIEQNRVTIQQYVRKLLPAGQSALINFVQSDDKTTWRFTLVAKQSVLTDEGIEAKSTNAERYTYLVEANQPNRTLASRLEKLGAEKSQNLKVLVEAFSVEKLSKLFFDEYKVQYDKFVKHLTGKIWTKSGVKEEGERISQFVNYFKTETDREKEARDFVKKLLGRIVFLYFVQKKGWLGTKTPDFNKGNQDFIYDLFKQIPDHEDQKERFYCDWLRPLFFDTLNRDDDHAFTMPDGSTVYIPFLNGGLFEEDKTDQNTEQLLLPGTLFSNPEDTESRNTRGFLDFLSAFNFTIYEDGPEEQTVAVDPEMLGHIFENLLEDNKDKGAYYTPKPIVHYMCQESLIEYLLTELTTEDTEGAEKEELRGHLEDLIKKQEAGELVGFTDPILKSLKEVKVCDPAIGSGAFPMGILQEIYQAVETFHHLQPDEVMHIWELPDDDWHPAEVKKQIIQNSIYGVDIEKGAVDIARLRFWLSLIVDEEEPTALPNLDYKIMVGDSLVSRLVIDGEEQIVNINWEMEGEVDSTKEHLKNLKTALNSIVEKQKKYFDAEGKDKTRLRNDIDQLKVEALIHQLHFDREEYVANNEDKGNFFEENTERKLKLINFNELIKKLEAHKNNTADIEYFDWKLDFPEVLNPAIANFEGFDIVIANPPYVSNYSRQAVKIESDLLKYYQENFEQFSESKQKSINSVMLFLERELSLGKEKSILTNIIDIGFYENVYQKTRNYLSKFNVQELVTNLSAFENVASGQLIIRIKKDKPQAFKCVVKDDFNETGVSLDKQQFSGKTITVSNKEIENIRPEIVELGEISEISCGLEYGALRKLFLSPTKKNSNYHKALFGAKNLPEPYKIVWREKDGYVLFDKNYEQELIDNGKNYSKTGKKVYFISGDESKYINNKILVRQSAKEIIAAADYQSYYALRSLFIISEISEKYSLEYILGILNSKFITKYSLERGIIRYQKGKQPQIRVSGLELIPIRKASKVEQKSIIEDVKKIQKLGTNNSDEYRRILSKIDLKVYKLYNLTWEEVQVVDPEFGLSEEEYEAVEIEGEEKTD